MNSTLVLSVLLVALGLVQAKIDYEEAEKQFEICKTETKAEETFEEVYRKKKIPTSEAGKCLVECMFRQKGVYNDKGEYSQEGVEKYLNKVFAGKPDNIEKAIKIAKECFEEYKDGGDLNKCELAVKRMTCGRTKHSEQGLKADD